eukprot:9748413-Ditylum_brightwellii.AAC.1
MGRQGAIGGKEAVEFLSKSKLPVYRTAEEYLDGIRPESQIKFVGQAQIFHCGASHSTFSEGSQGAECFARCS